MYKNIREIVCNENFEKAWNIKKKAEISYINWEKIALNNGTPIYCLIALCFLNKIKAIYGLRFLLRR